MSKSIAILGLGKYGRSLAENLSEMGADVLVADRNEELVRDFAPKVTSAVCVDLSDEEEIKLLGLNNMDMVVTAMGSDLAPSIMAVTMAKEAGVPFILAKASSRRMASILRHVGADKVIDPEDESGLRSARILMNSSVFDFFQLDKNLGIAEICPKSEWVGKTLQQLNLRKKHDINVIAIKKTGGNWKNPSPDQEIHEDEKLLVLTTQKQLEKL